ncbi:MAG: hypothetical protein AAF394_03615 [Planctomycetota bacterium]
MNSPVQVNPIHVPISFEGKYRLGGRRYRLFRRDKLALSLVAEMQKTRDSNSPSWALSFRANIRWVRNTQPAAVLTLAALRSEDEARTLIALWLRSFCNSKVGCRELLQLGLTNPGAIQSQVAQTLLRIGAWSQLRTLLEDGKLPEAEQVRLRKISEQRPFQKRLNRFLTHVPHKEHTRAEMPFFRSDTFQPQRKSLKPRWLTRMVLDRLCWLVSVRKTTDRTPF